ncbi:hypothetical protein BX661DRAFT_189383 [Kickxella alabastrina]|uniref:uncharacterized protein n=1 Tax=Kickxella alabastrina TaxID=61397 RepID=UPI00221FA720|nr:uncharacterized protein BX661DRAFT_189383 [Kickxella alabastrina]KAI7820212.1 hypothetical protein BX661DRAFT_189383 [Kickxella alabastrina]KAJ1944996.1 Structural maintenance of chromosomes protein 5 [Kickxella alabastrina]
MPPTKRGQKREPNHTVVEPEPNNKHSIDSDDDNSDPDASEDIPISKKRGRRAANDNGNCSNETQHNSNEYRAGSIMHISLRNFVTYDSIELSPGPNMNMIIGPNGTGKSTIVCAIALGLGEKTSVLGRAKDISEFVKHGHERGHIEITLAGHGGATAGDSGVVKIAREIIREGNKSTWHINGRHATATEVARTTRELQVQVGSLCQFLPQDRVVEFSKLSPQELLRETQVAVGREDLKSLQAELAVKRAQERQVMDGIQRSAQDTQDLRKKNELLERDVQRWQERLAAESQLRILTALVPVARYTEAKAGHDRAKEARRLALAAYQQAMNATGPAEEELEELEAKIAKSENQRRQLSGRRETLERDARRQMGKLTQLETAHRDLNSEMDELKKSAQRRREKIAALRAEVARLEAAHAEEQPPDEAASEDARRRLADLRDRKMQLNNEIVAVQEEQTALMASGQRINRQLEQCGQQLKDLDNVALKRREGLRRFHNDSYRALEWVEANRDKFKQHVFAPICLEASVQDLRYANLIETLASMSTLRTFVTQCKEDYQTLTRHAIDTMRLRIDVVCNNRSLNSFLPPHPSEAIRSLGFDGYALDFIEAPRPVLAAMCVRDNIHEIPIALGNVDNEAIGANHMFGEYIACGVRSKVTRGRYGSRAASVMTSRVKNQARLLSASGETEETQAVRERCSKEIDDFRDQLQANEQKMKKISQMDQKVRNAHRQIEAQEDELRQELGRRKEALRTWERHRVQLETKQLMLREAVEEDRQEANGGTQAQRRQRQQIAQRLKDNAHQRADIIAVIADAAKELVDDIHKMVATGLAGLKDARALGELRAEAERQREAITESKRLFDQATEDFNLAKQNARSALEETRTITEGMTDHERQAVRDAQAERGNMSYEELDIELSTCRQRLSMAANSGLSSRVMENYEERKKQLAEMISNQQRLEHELRKVRRRKQRLREQWEAPLAEIISKIGHNFEAMFDQIECMGEIRLKRAGDGVVYNNIHTSAANGDNDDGSDNGRPAVVPQDDEDYSNWGVEIRVAFRKNEALQALDNHRQSGGERAVSTILYLQSLQSLVAAPFRVVDEINQGMDQRNERLVHRLIVDTACKKGSSQYFLITPKLLPDLSYHPLMKVLCIFNGEWQPEAFNFNKYITNARRQPTHA